MGGDSGRWALNFPPLLVARAWLSPQMMTRGSLTAVILSVGLGLAQAGSGVDRVDRRTVIADLVKQQELWEEVQKEISADFPPLERPELAVEVPVVERQAAMRSWLAQKRARGRAVSGKYGARFKAIQARRNEDLEALRSLRQGPGAEKYVDFAFKELAQATMTRQGDTFRVSLPNGIAGALADAFPGHRLPENRDYVDLWADFDKALYLDEAGLAGFLPFCAAFGDFDGDAKQDIALALFRDVPKSFKVVAFHHEGNGYTAHVVREDEGKPSWAVLSAWERGISLSPSSEDGWIYVWDKGRYVLDEDP